MLWHNEKMSATPQKKQKLFSRFVPEVLRITLFQSFQSIPHSIRKFNALKIMNFETPQNTEIFVEMFSMFCYIFPLFSP